MVELDNMKSEIQTYQIPLQEVSASLDLENKEKRIEELEMEMQSPNFWDDPEISNKKMKESKNLKDTVDTMHGLLNQYRDILELIEMGYEENDPAIIPDIQAELDHFKSPLSGLYLVEVEFPDIAGADAFVPPSWFGQEVTEDPFYHNSAMSRLDPSTSAASSRPPRG